MSALDVSPNEQVRQPPWNTGEGYLFRIHNSDFILEDDPSNELWQELHGEVRVVLAGPSPDSSGFQLFASIGLTGFLANGEGKFCFLSTDVKSGLVTERDGPWEMDIQCDAEYLSEKRQRSLPAQAIDEYGEQFETPRIKYSVEFSAKDLSFPNSSGPAPVFSFFAGEIVFNPVNDDHAHAPKLVIKITEGEFTRLYTGRQRADFSSAAGDGQLQSEDDHPQAMLLAATSAEQCTAGEISADQLQLIIQPVVFTDLGGGNATGQLALEMIDQAHKVWTKACIDVVDQNPVEIENPDLRTSSDIDVIKLAHTTIDPLTIDIFFVANDLTGGGAQTLDGNTNLAKVFLSDNAVANPFLLAHELTHAFRGEHPPTIAGTPPIPGHWFGDHDTVAAPTNDLDTANVPWNSANNCLRANAWLIKRNPSLQTLEDNCCMKPDF